MAAKQALPGRRLNAFAEEPESLTIVTQQWMTEQGISTHPLYDERGETDPPEEFIRNVMKYGVLEAVTVVKEGEYVLVADGRQRVRAAQIANERLTEAGGDLMTVPVMLKRGDEDALADIVVVANVRRETSILFDARKAVDMLNRKQGDYKAVALAFAVDPRTVKQWEALMSCCKEVKRAVETGKLGIGGAVELSKLTPPQQRTQLAEQIKQAGGEQSKARISNDTVKAAVNGRVAISRPTPKVIKTVQSHPDVPPIIKAYEAWRTGQITQAEASQALPWLDNVVPQEGKHRGAIQ